MNNISLISALSENYVIGADGRLPWRQSDDLKFFKKMTLHKTILMGRKTFESSSLKKPLPDRVNVVLTKNQNFTANNVTILSSFEEALKFAESCSELMVIGGSEIYRLFLPYANILYLTMIHTKLEGDTFFPQFSKKDWNVVSSKKYLSDEKNEFDYTFLKYVRAS